jgi:S-adenosylmethionine uptake transporter
VTLPPLLRGALLGIAAMGVFAGYDVAVKFLGGSYHPFQIMFFAGMAAVPLVLTQISLTRTAGNYRPRLLRWTVIRCTITLANGMLGTYAFATLPLAQCYAIFFTMPLMISLLGVVMLGEAITFARLIAILAGFVGVIIALQPGSEPLRWAHLAAILGAVTGALNYVIMRKTGQIERPEVLVIYPMLSQLAAMAIALPFVYTPMPIEHHMLTWAMAVFGIGGTYVIIAAYRAAPVAVVAPMQYTQILWAALAAYFIFNEQITPATWAGLSVIIAAGVYILTTARGAMGGAGDEASV